MNYKIYIIEDDLSISLLLKDYITKYGFHVKVAENFENIMEDFNEFNPDVVLLDVNLPKYDGFYWCRKIRQKSKIPIIFISARDSGMDQEMAGILLEYLMKKYPKVVNRDFLLEKIWDDIEFVEENTLNVNVSRIRKRLHKLGIEDGIETVRGVGYRLNKTW